MSEVLKVNGKYRYCAKVLSNDLTDESEYPVHPVPPTGSTSRPTIEEPRQSNVTADKNEVKFMRMRTILKTNANDFNPPSDFYNGCANLFVVRECLSCAKNLVPVVGNTMFIYTAVCTKWQHKEPPMCDKYIPSTVWLVSDTKHREVGDTK